MSVNHVNQSSRSGELEIIEVLLEALEWYFMRDSHPDGLRNVARGLREGHIRVEFGLSVRAETY
jgi:hypothetical protein